MLPKVKNYSYVMLIQSLVSLTQGQALVAGKGLDGATRECVGSGLAVVKWVSTFFECLANPEI